MSAGWKGRIYRLLIRAYPRQFRDDYGDDMIRLLRDQRGDEPAWRVYSRLVVDLAMTIPVQHLEARMSRTPNYLIPTLYSVVAAGGAALAIVGGTNLAALITGTAIALIGGALAAAGWRRAQPIRRPQSTAVWWKLLIAGPCLIAAVIIGAHLGIDAWYVGMATVFAAGLLTSAGLVLGLVVLAGHHWPSLSGR